ERLRRDGFGLAQPNGKWITIMSRVPSVPLCSLTNQKGFQACYRGKAVVATRQRGYCTLLRQSRDRTTSSLSHSDKRKPRQEFAAALLKPAIHKSSTESSHESPEITR